MRTPNLGTVSYAPNQIPDDPKDLPRFLYDELNRIRTAIDLLRLGHLDKTYVAPAKPQDGDFVYADGTSFKPNGTGAIGIYYYEATSATWKILG